MQNIEISKEILTSFTGAVFALLRFSVKKAVTHEAVVEQEKIIEKEATATQNI